MYPRKHTKMVTKMVQLHNTRVILSLMEDLINQTMNTTNNLPDQFRNRLIERNFQFVLRWTKTAKILTNKLHHVILHIIKIDN